MNLGKTGKISSAALAATGRKHHFAGPIVAMSMVPAFFGRVLGLRDAWQKGFPFPQRPASGRQLFSAPYRAQLAVSKAELKAAFQLRFRVFNLELGEGLETSYRTGEDTDEFDRVCQHIIVTDERDGQVIGTYRLQTGASAARRMGYYSEREFDFAPYRILRDEMVELGRACIHPDHRKYEVLMLLWKAIVQYAVDHKARYMIGCSSLTTQDIAYGSAVYSRLKPALVCEPLRTVPTKACAFELEESDLDARPPKLLRTYLALGAKICGPPAFDREFKTIDFLTLMDLNNLTPAIRSRLLES
jgi:putative hemolysin